MKARVTYFESPKTAANNVVLLFVRKDKDNPEKGYFLGRNASTKCPVPKFNGYYEFKNLKMI
jgi:hypothetical protein